MKNIAFIVQNVPEQIEITNSAVLDVLYEYRSCIRNIEELELDGALSNLLCKFNISKNNIDMLFSCKNGIYQIIVPFWKTLYKSLLNSIIDTGIDELNKLRKVKADKWWMLPISFRHVGGLLENYSHILFIIYDQKDKQWYAISFMSFYEYLCTYKELYILRAFYYAY